MQWQISLVMKIVLRMIEAMEHATKEECARLKECNEMMAYLKGRFQDFSGERRLIMARIRERSKRKPK
jgi:hypothetical protein